ncbi:pyruvate, water dikinase regulatory protein [Pseudahrensia aquimaris]|uniref:Putative pyruvate, phosphate dikinase regulatory protein n=1 Tax=Pseudahrensia aquimaris TaxID=744461 RepID=A0ABW3FEX8_9HYPH
MAVRSWLQKAREKVSKKSFFHLHMISDSTGETLTTVGRAAAAQYTNWRAIEHISPMVRDEEALKTALKKIEDAPGIVLYTLVNEAHSEFLQARCRALEAPAINVLDPLTQVFDSHLGEKMSGQVGAQHALDEDYFGRLEALRFAMNHDDGNLPDDIEEIDVILIGISRTSKTPTSIYLAQRGLKVCNIPLVPGNDLPDNVINSKKPLIVALIASTERILQVRENRLLAFERDMTDDAYIDRASIQEELVWTRQLCQDNSWPMIDVSKRSVEETAAAILALMQNDS